MSGQSCVWYELLSSGEVTSCSLRTLLWCHNNFRFRQCSISNDLSIKCGFYVAANKKNLSSCLHSDTSHPLLHLFKLLQCLATNMCDLVINDACNFFNCMCFYQGWQSSLPLRRQSFVPGLQWMVTSLTMILTMKIFYLRMIPLHRAQVHRHKHTLKSDRLIKVSVQKHMHTSSWIWRLYWCTKLLFISILLMDVMIYWFVIASN